MKVASNSQDAENNQDTSAKLWFLLYLMVKVPVELEKLKQRA